MQEANYLLSKVYNLVQEYNTHILTQGLLRIYIYKMLPLGTTPSSHKYLMETKELYQNKYMLMHVISQCGGSLILPNHIKQWVNQTPPHDSRGRWGNHSPSGSFCPYRPLLHHSSREDMRNNKVKVPDWRRSMLSGKILNSRIPKSLDKPPKLDIYNCKGDPNEHVEHIDTILNYYHSRGVVDCKLFVLALKGYIMKRFKTLCDDCISSYKELSDFFIVQLTVWKLKPITIVILSGIQQKNEKILLEYKFRFTKV